MSAYKIIENIEPSRGNSEEFKLLAQEYCALIKSCGYAAKAFRENTPLNFNKCNLKQKMRAIAYLDANIEVLKECVSSGENPRNSATVLWRILKKIKATPEGDIFDKIDNGDVVEVYLDDHIQIFRNLEFFKCTTFSIDELLCGTWYKLYKRDFVSTLKMLKMAFRVLAGKLDYTTPWNVPPHVFEEIGSEGHLKQLINLKYLSPIKSQGKMVGAICISNASLVYEN